jgi:hypothetical protein
VSVESDVKDHCVPLYTDNCSRQNATSRDLSKTLTSFGTLEQHKVVAKSTAPRGL